jgi:DNA-binding LacI/PurR family transcriptional regulator
MQARVTLRDVAAKAGVHHTTASRALKNDPRVCAETLAKIRALATEMGYMPDPMLSALNAYRHASRPSQFHGTVAWITNFPTRDGWRASWGQASCYDLYFRGATEQLARHGYKLEEYWLQEPGMTARRSSQVLLHRGIRGLLLCPLQINRGHLSLQWDKFAAVSFGYSLLRPSLHLFSAAHFRAMITCMRTLRARGYQRIGMVTSIGMNERMDRMWTAAYRAELPTVPQSQEIPIYLYSDGKNNDTAAARKQNEALFLKWFRKYKPEVILTSSSPILGWLKSGGYRAPQNVSVVSAALQENEPILSGIVEASREIGAGAADFLVSMLQRGDHGIPRPPQRVLLEGSWLEGTTLGKAPLPQRVAVSA